MAWLLGWAVPQPWFESQVREAFPKASHIFAAAAPDALARLELSGPFEWVAGYSLGAFLLLGDAPGAARLGRVALLAPIFSLAREAGLGGRIHRTQLQVMARHMRREPRRTLADFYDRAGLDLVPDLATVEPLANLLWGLERLEKDRPVAALPPGWRAWCGEFDPLVDAARLRELAPGLNIVPGATHHPGALLSSFAEELCANGRRPSRGGSFSGDAFAEASARQAAGFDAAVSLRCRKGGDGTPAAGGVSREAAAASFDRAARTYVKHARVQAAMAEWLAGWIPSDRSGRALELGAGPGVFTRHLLPWRGALTASDISESMCSAGRLSLPDVAWEEMSAEAPARGPWDWIFSSSMLQWAADPAEVFAAWHSCLKQRGRVLAGLFVEGSLPELSALAGEPAPLTWREPAEWRRHLGGAGLALVRDETTTRSFSHDSARAFLRSLHGVGAAPERRYLPGRLRRLLSDYERRHGGKGDVRATWVFYRFEAERS